MVKASSLVQDIHLKDVGSEVKHTMICDQLMSIRVILGPFLG